MTKEQALIFEYNGAEEYGDYSGRSMYGEKTKAVTFDSTNDFYQCLSEILTDEDQGNRELIANFLYNDIRVDNMGRGIIVY